MPDYSKACIYKIKHNEDYNDENIYIGSTCNLIRRRCAHKTTCYNENCKDYNYNVYQHIRENGGWDSFVTIKVHDFPCESKGELEIEERRMIDLLQSKLNKNVPGRTVKEYYQDNRDKISERHKQYRQDNRDKYLEYNKQHYQDNHDKFLEAAKQYYQENRDKCLEKVKQKITCECGCIVSKGDIRKHKKTKKHQDLMAKI
tara:strand:- start:353 stop:955 length:603 start_codon:yes stop_codon:yes gene_type:complete